MVGHSRTSERQNQWGVNPLEFWDRFGRHHPAVREGTAHHLSFGSMLEPSPRRSRPMRDGYPMSAMARAAAAATLLALAVSLARAEEGGAPPGSAGSPALALPDDATLEASRAVVGEIRVIVSDIFDPTKPGEDNVVFRAANFVHVKTKESVIRHQLLFKEGDAYSRRLCEESARLLRGLGFLYDAKIRPVGYRDGVVDVEVAVRDVWTLRFGFNFSRKGGANRTSIGLEEMNFLGYGKNVAIHHTRDVDRVSRTYGYRDPSVLGSRVEAALAYADNSDGYEQFVDVGRPFYSLDTRWAVGGTYDRNDSVEPLYELGHAVARFYRSSDTATVHAGFSRGLVGGRAARYSAGFSFDRETFGPVPGERPPDPFPSDRTLAYPWIAFDSVQDGFITLQDLDKIKRTEDLNLAREGHARIGWAAPAFGSDRGRAIFEGSYRVGLGLAPGGMLLASAELSGRRSSGGFENVWAGLGARFYLRDLGRHNFYASLRGDMAYNLDRESQLLLGGDTGLRGYPLRYQDGNRRVLLTVEQRFYTDWEVLKLMRVGAAVFADAGRAWFAGEPGHDDLGVLKDVGLGLRLASSRSSGATMAHIDLAYALDGDPTIKKFQLYVSARETF
jgi:hemolysin activation/secretion protein